MALRGKPLRTVLATCTVLAGTAMAAPSRAGEVTADRLLNAELDKGNWLQHHGDYAARRHSPLNQINRDTAKNLRVAWTVHLGGV